MKKAVASSRSAGGRAGRPRVGGGRICRRRRVRSHFAVTDVASMERKRGRSWRPEHVGAGQLADGEALRVAPWQGSWTADGGRRDGAGTADGRLESRRRSARGRVATRTRQGLR